LLVICDGGAGPGVAVRELELGELDDVVAVVLGDIEAVVGVGGRVREPVVLALEALREVLVGLGVEDGPVGAVVGAR
jgi:hypothetical protein